MEDLLTLIGGIAISIISYFLKNAMDDLKIVKDVTYTNKSKIELLEKEYMLKIERLNEKITMLYDVIDRLNCNISELNKSIK